ncbi:MAG: FAD-dependent oxidoreductase [Planctomycetota bacterium]|nr:FAD-dependent oxidoreductase [Planctomycetota bacterium]
MPESNPNAWRCTVCGYVHQGASPPDSCPVCGVPRSAFEPQGQAGPVSLAPEPRRWECAVCGYVHEGPEPPEECPLCGATRDQFQAARAPGASESSKSAVRVVIIGGGIAGLSAAEAVSEAGPQAEITLLCAENELPYYRLNLTRYLAGEVDRPELLVHPQEWYEKRRIDLRLGAEAIRLHPVERVVELRSGDQVRFGRLILTSGAHPFVPPLPGTNLQGVVSLRTIADADRLLQLAQPGCRCVCVGGGLLGLETAGALARRGVQVTVLESHGYLMPSQLDPVAGAVLGRHLAKIGVALRSGVHVKALAGEARVNSVVLEEGDGVAADVVVLSTGVRSNSYLARQAVIEVKKGIVVNNRLATANADILAAGDAAEHLGVVYGNWAVAQSQGRIAGMNAVGIDEEFLGVPRAHTLKILGLDTFSIGQFSPPDGSYRVFAGESDGRYRSFVFRDGLLVGANLVGDASLAAIIRTVIETRKDLSDLLARSPAVTDVAARLAELD